MLRAMTFRIWNRVWGWAAMALVAGAAGAAGVARAAAPADTLIPLDRLLSPPRYTAVRLSPDGTRLSWIAPVNGVRNLWVAPADDPSKAKPVTRDTGRGLAPFNVSNEILHRWTPDSRRILFPRDHDGDENWQWFALDLASGAETQLTDVPTAQVRLIALGDRDASHALIGINDRDPRRHDVYMLDLATGARTLVEKNERFVAWIADRGLRLRFAVEVTKGGGYDVMAKDESGAWVKAAHVESEDTQGRGQGFDAANRVLYATSSAGRNTLALVARDSTFEVTSTIAGNDSIDIGGILFDPRTGAPQAVSTMWERRTWKAIDPAVQPDLDAIAKGVHADYTIEGRANDDRRWLVRAEPDDGPAVYWLYDRPAHRVKRLFSTQPELDGMRFAATRGVVTRSRDGLALVSFLTLPRDVDSGTDRPRTPQPTVMLVHGGPGDERAERTFAPFVQWLANRGYAVFNVNFRGSPGFGKNFVNAERLEWGGRMIDDLVDQARWAIRAGVADSTRLALMGGSYGGYATLCGVAFHPDVFTVGVDVVGPADLETFINTIPPTWSLDHFAKRVGDPRTPEGRAHLRARSPIHAVRQVTAPMLIAQGAHDSRVPQAESDRMVAALDSNGVRVTYLLYPDEGHGFLRQENASAFNAITEAFLARNLGGLAQPLGDVVAKSSVQVPVGADRVPGLAEALARRPAPAVVQASYLPIDAASCAEHSGTYTVSGFEIYVRCDGGRLWLDVPGQSRIELLSRERDGFALSGTAGGVRFTRGAGGKISGFTLTSPDGSTTKVEKMS